MPEQHTTCATTQGIRQGAATDVRVTIAEFLNRDLGKVSEPCNLSRIQLNASKTETTIVCMPHTVHPQSLPINYCRYCDKGV